MIDLTPHELEIVRDILRRHVPDREVRVYGSRARGNAKAFSDLDLAIMGSGPLASAVIAAMTEEFIESDLRFKVDISDWASLSQAFRDNIRDDLTSLPNEAP